MKKRQLLLQAAAIVEKAEPHNFSMSNLNQCILAHVRRKAGFEKLNNDIANDTEKFVLAGARFFGITMEQSEKLFNGDAIHITPKRAAAALRKVAGAPPKRKRKVGVAGMKVVQKAVKEALAVPTRRVKAQPHA
jgi:hypothetical protein